MKNLRVEKSVRGLEKICNDSEWSIVLVGNAYIDGELLSLREKYRKEPKLRFGIADVWAERAGQRGWPTDNPPEEFNAWLKQRRRKRMANT